MQLCRSQRLKTRHVERRNGHFLNFETLTPSEREGFAASPIDTAKPEENQGLKTRHVGASKRAFRARNLPISKLGRLKIDVFRRVVKRTWKFSISKSTFLCVASGNFHHMAENAMPAREFAPCRHSTQPCQRDSQKTRKTTCLKCCTCHAK